MEKPIIKMALVLPLILTAASGMAVAQTASPTPVAAVIEDNAQERINQASQLRVLTQKIPAAVCHLNRSIAPEESANVLVKAVSDFEQILTALEFGDADLNIAAPETRPRSLAAIHELRAQWQPVQAAATAVINGTATQEDLRYVMLENQVVLDAAQRTLEEMTQQYANPNAVTFASLFMIDLAGRQMLLVQKIGKEACLWSSTPPVADVREELAESVRIFEATMEALRFGMPALGIGAPPNAEIQEELEAALNEWNAVKPIVTGIIAGERFDTATGTIKYKGLDAAMHHMDRVVTMYVAAAAPSY
ncbi:type IV pili methyl-accepting chemotaxis transducer N-terminal domain-containing protein [Yoonia sp.]|uniref:type IV pili methyl-accepting chemotaxis transducer N-terminal domain-containing protein n=1 Tax=Yoonia sp. TaxID=2212373 RepID=UPI002DFA53FC|nr:type IV pili methyl-accepting chemotaxis transducer N-terminal domain-containing protein [Yoonia sp.]